MKYCIILMLLTFASFSCNKISSQLPVVVAAPAEITMPLSISGSEKLEVTFSQVTVKDHDTVYVSVRNTSGLDIDSVTIMIEQCKGNLHNFDSCYKQIEIKVGQIKNDSTETNVYKIPDRKIDLDSSLINIQLLLVKFSNQNAITHPLAGIYSNGLLRFVDTAINDRDSLVLDTANVVVDTIEIIDRPKELKYYGDMRGYVNINGDFVFRIKTSGPVVYNITGKFDDSAAIRNGRLTLNDQLENVVSAAAPPSGQPTISLSERQLSFSMHLEKPMEPGSVDSISVNAIKL